MHTNSLRSGRQAHNPVTGVSAWSEVEKIFNKAIDLPAELRASFVEKRCRGNESLRRDVMQLLEADVTDESFLEAAPAGQAGRQLFEKDLIADFLHSSFAGYQLQKLIYQGSSSAIFLGENKSRKSLAALKIVPAPLAENERARFALENEARLIGEISHGGIVRLDEFGQYRRHPFLAMEYLEGATLRQLIGAKQMTAQFVVSIARQLSSALGALEERRIVHCDIKPENIIVSPDGTAKLLDFGIARNFDNLPDEKKINYAPAPGKLPGFVAGTPAYMSPEQIRGENLDQRSDLWSLGVVLYEMIAGHRPFSGQTRSSLLGAIIGTAPPQLAPEIAIVEAFSGVLEKCLAKDRLARYPAISDLQQAITGVQAALERAS